MNCNYEINWTGTDLNNKKVIDVK